MGKLPKSINFHLTHACNYRCRFCFAQYGTHTTPLTLTNAKHLITILSRIGCTKLNFAGGEPTLIPHLSTLIQYAKDQGLFVSLISNGTGITPKFLNSCGNSLDLIGLSIDSADNTCEFRLGRTFKSCSQAKAYSHVDQIIETAHLIHQHNIPLKINTTITVLNFQEDMHPLMHILRPIRWKVFQVHHVQDVNDSFFTKQHGINEHQFQQFIDRHRDLHPIYESSEIMADSYCMITPDGRFYYSIDGVYRYSKPILAVGIQQAFSEVKFNPLHFQDRTGDYYQVSPPVSQSDL